MPPDVVLSPRGRARSARLAACCGSVRVARDNQAVIDASDTVLICVRPPQAAAILRPLRWRRAQSVVSVVAGLPIAALAGCVGPVTDIARAIPLPAVARRGAPTPVHPPTAAACRLFDRLGGALPDRGRPRLRADVGGDGNARGAFAGAGGSRHRVRRRRRRRDTSHRPTRAWHGRSRRLRSTSAQWPASTRRPAASTSASPRCSTTPSSSRSSSAPLTASSETSRTAVTPARLASLARSDQPASCFSYTTQPRAGAMPARS